MSALPFWERPCAAPGLISYRYVMPFGYIMIGANNDDDAMKEVNRSLSHKTTEKSRLERWNGKQYVKV